MEIQNKKFANNNRVGLTLIEIILYVSVVAIVLSSLIPFAWSVIQTGVKSSTQQEVYSQARFISERIKYEIRNSYGIGSGSVFPGKLVLCTNVSCSATTTISLSGTDIQIDQGLGAVNLNSTTVVVSSLAFTDYSSSDDKTKHVGFTIGVSSAFSGGQEYEGSTTIESSAEVRSN